MIIDSLLKRLQKGATTLIHVTAGKQVFYDKTKAQALKEMFPAPLSITLTFVFNLLNQATVGSSGIFSTTAYSTVTLLARFLG